MYVEIVHVQPPEIIPQVSSMHSPHFTMDADQERAYSALEVVSCQRAYQESQLEISQSSAEGKEVAPDGGKITRYKWT